MKNKYWLLAGIVISGVSFASLPTNLEIGENRVSLPTVEPERCNEERYFGEYRTAANAAINQTHDQKVNEIHQDNQANADTIVTEAGTNVRDFLQAHFETCLNYYDVCTSAASQDFSRVSFEENTKICNEQSEKSLLIAMGLTRAATLGNANRKAMTTLEEKNRATIARNKEILFPILENLVSLTGELASKTSRLIEQGRDAGPEVQDS